MSVSKLELRKLLLDLNYWKSEVELKKDIIDEIDIVFKQSIDDYLQENEEIRKSYEKIKNIKDTKIQSLIDKNSTSIKKDEKKVTKIKNPLLRRVYRDVVKLTHPDKMDESVSERERKKREKIYVQVTESYKSNNLTDVLQYAYNLDIDFKLDDDNLKIVKESVKNYQNQSSFLENTISYKWYYSDERNRNKIILNFIKN